MSDFGTEFARLTNFDQRSEVATPVSISHL